MLVMYFLALAFAWDKSAGLNTTAVAIRSSSGNHRTHAGLGGWVQQCSERMNLQHCWQGKVDGSVNAHQVPEGQMSSYLARISGGYGILLGVEKTKVGFSAGPSFQILLGGTSGSVVLFQPGVQGQISLQKPISERMLLFLGNGYTVRAWTVDPDLTIGIGRRW